MVLRGLIKLYKNTGNRFCLQPSDRLRDLKAFLSGFFFSICLCSVLGLHSACHGRSSNYPGLGWGKTCIFTSDYSCNPCNLLHMGGPLDMCTDISPMPHKQKILHTCKKLENHSQSPGLCLIQVIPLKSVGWLKQVNIAELDLLVEVRA